MEQSSILFHKTFSVDKHFVLVKMFLLLKDYFWALWIIFKWDSDELEDCQFIFEVKWAIERKTTILSAATYKSMTAPALNKNRCTLNSDFDTSALK